MRDAFDYERRLIPSKQFKQMIMPIKVKEVQIKLETSNAEVTIKVKPKK